ncbi:hypothetical protein [Magnetospirillum molischianum]|uniref:Uncharacterized protein n=1 Tax=Magnetospirillum molischianum DSM 120 TaxID=1150626 RepID=H8FY11_MAGML|nr:hypothetical protein [Magnetospirillum molischianum]CCG43249.1 hypothetical protein PHAMO_80040 [Magnetospirillum molischianum DSM 120]
MSEIVTIVEANVNTTKFSLHYHPRFNTWTIMSDAGAGWTEIARLRSMVAAIQVLQHEIKMELTTLRVSDLISQAA